MNWGEVWARWLCAGRGEAWVRRAKGVAERPKRAVAASWRAQALEVRLDSCLRRNDGTGSGSDGALIPPALLPMRALP